MKQDELACKWLNATNNNLSLDKEDMAYGDSLMPTILNSPPDSVKSNLSNGDDMKNDLFNVSNEMETEESFIFVEEFNEPTTYTQDYVYSGALGFQEEIEQVSNEQSFNFHHSNIDYIKTEDDSFEESTPLLRDQNLMFSPSQNINERTAILKSFVTDKYLTNKEVNNNVQLNQRVDQNMNLMPMKVFVEEVKPVGAKQSRPKLKLNIKLRPMQCENTSNDNPANTQVISTPQLTKEVLEMEEEGFDLIKFIDADHVSVIDDSFYGCVKWQTMRPLVSQI